jgi:hypothetical protein
MPFDTILSTVAPAKAEWLALIALGAFHGINPGMGWLFAVALGMQERRRGAVLRALVPLGAGHALAVAAAVGLAFAIGTSVSLSALRWPVAGLLVSLGIVRYFRHWHPRWVGMRVGMGGLTMWSFLMASAHGAGLMVVPVLLGMSMADAGGHAHHAATAAGTTAIAALVATGVHAVSYLAVTAFVAVLVFEKLGVGILRRAWLNLDLIWAAALVASGAATLAL